MNHFVFISNLVAGDFFVMNFHAYYIFYFYQMWQCIKVLPCSHSFIKYHVIFCIKSFQLKRSSFWISFVFKLASHALIGRGREIIPMLYLDNRKHSTCWFLLHYYRLVLQMPLFILVIGRRVSVSFLKQSIE